MQEPVSLIILVHQEAEVIEKVVENFYTEIISKIPGSEFIVCEDGSTDGTKEILLNIQKTYNLTLNMKNEKMGYNKALREAFGLAKNNLIFFSDSDGQHNPKDFWEMYKIINDYDMVIGWKKHRKDSWFRLLTTKIFNKIINIFFNIKLHDSNCGFRLIKKDLVNFLLTQEWKLDHCISAELTIKAASAGYKLTEIPITHYSRLFGDSRGLPIKKLPQIVFHIIKTVFQIHKDINLTKNKG